MNQDDSVSDAAFRAEVRAFLRDHMPEEIRLAPRNSMALDVGLRRRWHRILADKGWAVPSWPVEYGGTGWNVRQQAIFQDEMGMAGAPGLIPFLNMIGPLIYTYGTPEQKAQHLPPTISGEVQWCQGYSEPGAGSDLASLKMRAESDGDDYVLNGQKIWTSYAHDAQWMFCLVRTSNEGKPQNGITFLLIDMETPGMTIRPIRSIDGLHHLNEVFFNDVRVPKVNRVGEEDKGWTYAKFLLEHERSNVAGIPQSKYRMAQIMDLARQDRPGGALMNDPDFRRKLVDAHIDMIALEAVNGDIIGKSVRGEKLGTETSMLKLMGTLLSQRISELGVEALGPYAAVDQAYRLEGTTNRPLIGPAEGPEMVMDYLFNRASTIYGGSSEVQRNVIAKATLGL